MVFVGRWWDISCPHITVYVPVGICVIFSCSTAVYTFLAVEVNALCRRNITFSQVLGLNIKRYFLSHCSRTLLNMHIYGCVTNSLNCIKLWKLAVDHLESLPQNVRFGCETIKAILYIFGSQLPRWQGTFEGESDTALFRRKGWTRVDMPSCLLTDFDVACLLWMWPNSWPHFLCSKTITTETPRMVASIFSLILCTQSICLQLTFYLCYLSIFLPSYSQFYQKHKTQDFGERGRAQVKLIHDSLDQTATLVWSQV